MIFYRTFLIFFALLFNTRASAFDTTVSVTNAQPDGACQTYQFNGPNAVADCKRFYLQSNFSSGCTNNAACTAQAPRMALLNLCAAGGATCTLYKAPIGVQSLGIDTGPQSAAQNSNISNILVFDEQYATNGNGQLLLQYPSTSACQMAFNTIAIDTSGACRVTFACRSKPLIAIGYLNGGGGVGIVQCIVQNALVVPFLSLYVDLSFIP